MTEKSWILYIAFKREKKIFIGKYEKDIKSLS